MVIASSPNATVTHRSADVVLPRALYWALLGELIGLVLLHRLRPETSASESASYTLGWLGVGSMLIMHAYSVRRRVRALRHFGALRHWLWFHIFCGLQGALFVVYHSWHTRHLRNIQGFNLVCVSVVVLSGLFGRYLFSFLPKSAEGDRLSGQQLDVELEKLSEAIDQQSPHIEITVPVLKFDEMEVARPNLTSLMSLVGQHVRTASALRQLRRRLRERGEDPQVASFMETASARLRLASRRETLSVAARLFSRWTWFHRPLTLVLLGLTLLHIWAHYVYGTR